MIVRLSFSRVTLDSFRWSYGLRRGFRGRTRPGVRYTVTFLKGGVVEEVSLPYQDGRPFYEVPPKHHDPIPILGINRDGN